MTLRAIVVDDETLGRTTVRSQCQAAGDVEVVGESASGEEAIRMIRNLRPDVAFLDIHMRPVSGLQVAASISATDMPVIVFVTAHDQYAVTAFELNAVDYLLKPFDKARFGTMLARVRRRVGPSLSDATRQESHRVALSIALQLGRGSGPEGMQPVILEIAGRVHLLRQAEIEYVEANGNYLTFSAGDRTYTVRGTLTELEQQLAPPAFLRIRRSVLVNANHVRNIEKWNHGEYLLEMSSGRRFSTGRRYRRRLQSIVRRRHEETASK